MNPSFVPAHRARRTAPVLLVSLLLAVTGFLAPSGPAVAEPAPGTTITLSAPAFGKAGLPARFTIALTDAGGAPVVGARVTLQQLTSAWTAAGSATTDSTGRAVVTTALPAGTTSWRASYAGDGVNAPSVSPTSLVLGQRFATTLKLSGPPRIVDERTGTLSVLWTAADGSPVRGAITIHRRVGTGPWVVHRRLSTSATGRVALTVAPRTDTTWRATGAAGSWWLATTSSDLFTDNVPQVAPVVLPAKAPRPAATPAQPRATGAGANARVTRIPTNVWRSMVGRSWHRGCPVGRARLRLIQVNYWGFDGYRYRGEMVLRAGVAGRAAAALRDMYDARYPIRRMYRVDRFGWSKVLRGANDYASMRADNTSGFNCRSVVNKPRVRSPHARGRSVDVNTWENPYRSATGLVPNSWWASRSHPRVAWRSSSHPVVKIWRRHGFRWTYGNNDSQHMDGRKAPGAGSIAGSFTG